MLPAPTPQSQADWNSQGVSQTPNTNFTPYYQIKPDDTFNGVANNHGLDLNSLSSLNQGAKSLPPVGSYIQVQKDDKALPNSPKGAYVGQGTYLPGAHTQSGQSSQIQQGSSQSYTGGATVYPNADALNAARNKVQQQYLQGIQPATLDFSTPIINPNTGQPVSDAYMQQSGYVKDERTSKWILGGTNTANSVTGLPQGSTQTATGYVDTKGKFVRTVDAQGNPWDATTATRDIYGDKFIQKGAIRWERVHGKLQRVKYLGGGKKKIIKGGGGGGQQVAATPQAGSTDSRSTVLGLHLGSG